MAPPENQRLNRASKAAKNRSSQAENHPDSELQNSVNKPQSAASPRKTPTQTQAEGGGGSPKKGNSIQGSSASGEKPKTRRRSRSRRNRSKKPAKESTSSTPRESVDTPPPQSGQNSGPSSPAKVSQSSPTVVGKAGTSPPPVDKASETPSGGESKSTSTKENLERSPVTSNTCASNSVNKVEKMSDKKLDDLCQLLQNIVMQHGDGSKPSSAPPKPQKPQKPIAQDPPVAKPVPAEVKSEVGEADSQGDKSREEIERERKARKEAKKAAKKKGDQDKDKESANESTKENANQNQKEGKPQSKPAGEKPAPLQPSKQGQDAGQQKAESLDSDGKSKADLKRERREKQEAQRQAKALAKAQQEAERQKKNQPQSQKAAADEPKKAAQPKKKPKKSAEEDNARRIPLLGHLTPYTSSAPSLPVNCDTIHPAIRTLGLKMKDRVVDGSTTRVIATLAALKRFISDYRTPESCDLSRDLAEKMRPNVAHLHACRPLAIAMDNAVRFLKHKINSIEPNVPEAQAKDLLRTAIDEYVRDNINLASSTIATHASQLLQDGDVILTFGYSALVCDMVEAVSNGGSVNISVVVADSPYPPSGADMVKRLAAMGVTTYYRLITDVTHIMHKVTKVVVEAEAVMMNGAVQGICGTAGLALAAATHDTPFIVLSQTYKFSNNDLTDSLVVNELGDANGIVNCPSSQYRDLLKDWQETDNLNVVSLVYDVTPASLVTVLVTEQSVLPTSAVPVIIRRNYADILGQD